ncbi:TPM domain-containing protein [Curtobacterium sp. RRHDQ10]|uniref:TPM domain-containing protein n=1 Tax=Curtobacterium phyllosphaerae TaxID=3413379 RepID=UPI003BF41F89
MAPIRSGATTTRPRDRRRGPSVGNRLAAALLAAVIGAALTILPAAGASATAPVDLDGAYVVDDANALTPAQERAVKHSLDDLYASTKTRLFVVFVPSFSDPSDQAAWGRQTLEQNQLDTDSVLLSVAVQDRLYNVSQSDTSNTLSASDVQQATEQDLVPKLRDSDWAGATESFAAGLAATQAPPDFSWVWIALAVIVVGVAVLLLVLRSRRRAAATKASAAAEADLAELERRAGGALVTIDDELRTAEQEVGFAVAQFGPDAAEPFVRALATAKKSVQTAFKLQQQLDDEIPDTVEQRADWSRQIVAICEQAHATIEEQTDSFDELRSLEDGVDQAAVELRKAVTAAQSSLTGADAALETLRSRWTGRTLASVEGNVDQAQQVLDFATERTDAADAALASGDKGAAVIAVRDAQHALAQIAQLTGAVIAADGAFDESVARVATLRTEVEADVAAGKRLRGTPGDSPDVTAAVAAAETTLRRDVDPKDPVTALDRLTQVNTAIDAALARARSAAEQAQHAAAALDAALRDARLRISQARDFISTRRGGVGSTARTRLSEAERALDDAVDMATSDPAQAIRAARAAEQYAAAAIDAANDDMGGWPGQGGGGNGNGAQLGGLVTGLVLGGLFGGRGGSYGGGGFGGGFGGGGGGGFSGGGGFGGGGGGGGGGFSGGGRF